MASSWFSRVSGASAAAARAGGDEAVRRWDMAKRTKWWNADDAPGSASGEDRLALLEEGALCFLGVFGLRQRHRVALLVAVGVARRHRQGHAGGFLGQPHRDRALGCDLARDAHRIGHQ